MTKPVIGQAIEFNPDGTDKRLAGKIIAVHSANTVSAEVIDDDGVTLRKPDIHFCAPNEPCEVSMCKAVLVKSDSKAGKPKKTSGKPTVNDIKGEE